MMKFQLEKQAKKDPSMRRSSVSTADAQLPILENPNDPGDEEEARVIYIYIQPYIFNRDIGIYYKYLLAAVVQNN